MSLAFAWFEGRTCNQKKPSTKCTRNISVCPGLHGGNTSDARAQPNLPRRACVRSDRNQTSLQAATCGGSASSGSALNKREARKSPGIYQQFNGTWNIMACCVEGLLNSVYRTSLGSAIICIRCTSRKGDTFHTSSIGRLVAGHSVTSEMLSLKNRDTMRLGHLEEE